MFSPEELAGFIAKFTVKENLMSPLPNDPSLPQFIPPYVHYTKGGLHYIEKGKSGVPNPNEETPEPITFTDNDFDEVMDKCTYKIVEEVGKFCFGGKWKDSLREVDIESVMETLIDDNKIRFVVDWYVPPYIVEGKSGQSIQEYNGGLDVVFEIEIKNPTKEDVLTFLCVKGLAGYGLVYHKEADVAEKDEPEKSEAALEAEKKALENNKASMEKAVENYEKDMEKLGEKGSALYEGILEYCQKLDNEIESSVTNIQSASTDAALASTASLVTTSTGAGYAVNAIPIQLSNLKKFANLIAKSLSTINSILDKLHLEAYAGKDPSIKAIFVGIKAALKLIETAVTILGGG